jgi:hypothetical protein
MTHLISPLLQHEFAENIALLSCLGQNHDWPKRNSSRLTKLDNNASSHTLSLKDEYHLTTTLAFLSSIKDDKNLVTAVCVQESLTGLTALIAVNTNTACDSTYLKEVEVGFNGLFSILRHASTSKCQTSCISQVFQLTDI